MQRDYSDAINLLEGKLCKNQEEVTNMILLNEKLKKDLEVAEQQSKFLVNYIFHIKYMKIVNSVIDS